MLLIKKTIPFTPFSGYTPETKPENKIITKNETNDASTDTENQKLSMLEKINCEYSKTTNR